VLEFNNSNYNLSVEGNWYHYGVLNENYGTITFTGSNNQTITGNPNETFWNLTVDKSGGLVQPVDGNTNIFVTNDFRINNGTFETGPIHCRYQGILILPERYLFNDASGLPIFKTLIFPGGTNYRSSANRSSPY
jgi:hypothetical protein